MGVYAINGARMVGISILDPGGGEDMPTWMYGLLAVWLAATWFLFDATEATPTKSKSFVNRPRQPDGRFMKISSTPTRQRVKHPWTDWTPSLSESGQGVPKQPDPKT
jgi:hypothetical protein